MMRMMMTMMRKMMMLILTLHFHPLLPSPPLQVVPPPSPPLLAVTTDCSLFAHLPHRGSIYSLRRVMGRQARRGDHCVPVVDRGG